MIMKKFFKTHLEAIEWISEYAQNEAHFEILREELTFNFIYTDQHFIHLALLERDIVWLE